MNSKFLIYSTFFLIILFTASNSTYAQSGDILFEYIVKDDQVYIYQMQNMRTDYAYNIYRMDSGSSEFVQLNTQPRRAVLYPDQFRNALGSDYQRIKYLLEAENHNDVFFELRGNSSTARLYALAFPNVAKAVNRLFIDEDAPVGSSVTYRIEILNQRDEPVGITEDFEVVLEEKEIAQPAITDMSNRGTDVDVTWMFPTGSVQDHVIQFELIYQPEDSDDLIRATDVLLIRDRSRGEYTYRFTFEDLDQMVTFYISAVDYAGARGPLSEPYEILIEENIPPSIITGVRTAFIDENIRLIWSMSTELDAAGYNVYRSYEPSENFEQVNEELIPVNLPEFVDTTVERGNRYFYKITAIDENENESEKSTVVSRLITDYTPPPVPAELTAEFLEESGNIFLTWETDPLPDNFKTFHLFRRPAPNNIPDGTFEAVNIDDIKETEYMDEGIGGTGFIEGTTFQYAIISADSSRNMSDTTYTFIHVPNITPPSPPRRVMASNRNAVRVNVVWDASMSGDVVNYTLYRKKESEEEFDKIKEFPLMKRQYRDENIQIGETYMYAVAAVDSSDNVSEITESAPVFIRSSNPPRRVRNVQAVASQDSIRITWEPVVSDVLQGYNLYVSNRSTGIFENLFDEPQNITEFITTADNQKIWFRVTSVDKSGNESRRSEPARIIVRE